MKRNTVMFEMRDYFRILRNSSDFTVKTGKTVKGVKIDFMLTAKINGEEFSILIPNQYEHSAFVLKGDKVVNANLTTILCIIPRFGMRNITNDHIKNKYVETSIRLFSEDNKWGVVRDFDTFLNEIKTKQELKEWDKMSPVGNELI